MAGTDSPRTSARHLGYAPTVAVICLTLATPIGWGRRAWALAWGTLWVHLFIACRSALVLAYAFHGDRPYCVFSLSPTWGRVLYIAYDLAAVEPAVSYVVPLFMWIATVFRRSDLEQFAGGRFHEPA